MTSTDLFFEHKAPFTVVFDPPSVLFALFWEQIPSRPSDQTPSDFIAYLLQSNNPTNTEVYDICGD